MMVPLYREQNAPRTNSNSQPATVVQTISALRLGVEDDAQVDQKIDDECDRNPYELGRKGWQPHHEHSHERDADIHREANECSNQERSKAAQSCRTIEHKLTGQVVIDKGCDAEAKTACDNDAQFGVHEQHKAARIDDSCDSASHSIL